MILFHEVGKRYPGGHQALEDISFHLAEGEMAFLTGHSGAGKSTVLRLIAHIELCTHGQILVGGRNTTRLKRAEVTHLRRRIGFVFQDHRLLPDRTVFDNVALPLVIAGLPHRELGRRVRAALDKVGLLDKEGLRPRMLSGGEQQRVGIARAVVGRPPLILADEPTGNLDPDLSREVMSLFAAFNRIGLSVLVATHDVGLVRFLGHRILELRDGRLEGDYADGGYGF